VGATIIIIIIYRPGESSETLRRLKFAA